MKHLRRLGVIGAVAALLLVPFGSSPSMAQSRAHVYLLRGLMNIFSLGMDELAAKIEKRGVYASVHNHSEWQSLADSAAAAYKAGREGPIILIGHSLGADAVMQMADYLDKKGIPLALVVPFDATQSFSTPKNVVRLVNITQRDYAYMRRGAGFHGSLSNLDVSSDQSIGHISIDKSPRLHAQVVGFVLSAVGAGHRLAAPTGPRPKPAALGQQPSDAAKHATGSEGASKPEAVPEKPVNNGKGASDTTATIKPLAAESTPIIAAPAKPAPVVSHPHPHPPAVGGSAKVAQPPHSMPD